MDVTFETNTSFRCGTCRWTTKETKKQIVFPGCILSTNAGSVPHLTSETYSYIPKDLQPGLTNVPLASVIDHDDTVAAFPGSISEFFSLPPQTITVISTKDSLPRLRGNANPSLNTAKAVSVWGNNGRIMVDPERHLDLLSKLNPDIYEILADGDTAMDNVSKKRTSKSFANSIKFLDDSLKILSRSTKLKDSLAMPSLQGGNNVELRKQYSDAALKLLEVDFLDRTIGFSVDGINPQSNSLTQLVKASISYMPENKLRFFSGPQSPKRICELIEAGIDLFDTSYPTILAQKNLATVFHIPVSGSSQKDQTLPTNQDLLDLSDDSNRLQFLPLLEGCQCYTCQNHSRAYMYHLISVKELLAPILLTLHNLHHYLLFFRALREAVASDRYDDFKLELLDRTVFTD